MITASAPPWEPDSGNVKIHTKLARAVRRDAPADARRKAAEDTLQQLPPADIEIYTDGSATAGTENGGAGVVIWEGSGEAEKIKTPAGKFTSSYQTELHALNTALEHLERNLSRYTTPKIIRLCSDSQSALLRLAEGHANQTERLPNEVWTRLKRIARKHRVDLQWVPGHAGIPGNEIADEVAKQAAELNQGSVPINLNAAKAQLKRHLGREWAESNRGTRYYSIVGSKKVPLGDKIGLNREEGVAVSRLRTNNSLALRAYRTKIQLEDDDTCTGV